MKFVNLSSLFRDSSETQNLLSLIDSKGFGINSTVITTSGNINNLSTDDISSIKLTQATTLTGLANGVDGKIVIIHNASPSNLTIANNSGSSSSGNKIYTGSTSDLTLLPNSSVLLQYDSDSTIWRVIGISNSHNELTGKQGGDGTNFYHSNQPINTNSNVSFNNLTVVSGVNATGSIKLNNITYPSTDGISGQALITNGSGTLSFTNVSQVHNDLTSIQGGSVGNYYHSNQPINTTSNVRFNNLTVVSGVNATGSIKLNNITYPTSDGTSGQALATDGNGNLYFTTAGAGTVLDTYITSKAVQISNNSTSSVNALFSEVVSGIYTFWVSTDPRIKGTFYLNQNDISNSVLETISSSVSGKQDNANCLNVYISSGNIIFQNKLGSQVVVAVRRETSPSHTGGGSAISSVASHADLTNLQGGDGQDYFHSNQPINTTSTVTFAGINVPLIESSASGTLSNVSTNNVGAFRFTCESSTAITGFANGSNGKLLYLHNASAVNVTFKNNSTSSLLANRIITGNNGDLILGPDKSITLQYDSFSSKWRVLGGSGGNSGQNPETLNLSNTNSTIDFSNYSTTSFRIKNPAQMTFTNGVNGTWYTLAIVSDGSYSFTSETRFPLNNAQPVPSSGTVDMYSLHCIDTVSGTRYLATFAYDYSGVILP